MGSEIEIIGTAAGDVAAAVAGTSPAREGLEWVADVIRGRRARTQIKVLTKTAEALTEAGLTAKVVPDKTLVPLLEFAGLEEEDDDMIERWANLLASAATASDAPAMPSFPDILRQLTQEEVRALDYLVGTEGAIYSSFTFAVARETAKLRDENLDNLERLGLVRFSERRRAAVWDDLKEFPPSIDHREMVELTARPRRPLRHRVPAAAQSRRRRHLVERRSNHFALSRARRIPEALGAA